MAERKHRRALRALGFCGLGLGIVVVPVLATGCLYLLRGLVANWPGPRVPDALWLDTIPHHADVPLVVFVLVFSGAGVLLAAIGRALRLNRLSAALVLFTGVGLWSFVLAAVSIFVVLQVSISQAIARATSTESVYLAAALAGLAGAMLSPISARGRRSLTLIVYAVNLGAFLDVLAVVYPRSHGERAIIGHVSSGFLPPTAAALIVPAAVLLFLAGRGLSRRSHSAWQLTLLLLGTLTVLDLLHGLDIADALVTLLLSVLLVARRNEFDAAVDPGVRPSAIVNLAAFVGVAFAFAFVTLLIARVAANVPVHLSSLTTRALGCLLGQSPSARVAVRGHLANWLPWAVVGIEAIGVARAAGSLTAPWRARHSINDPERSLAAEVVRSYGRDTLAPFALRADKDWFIYRPDEEPQAGASVLIAYRVVRAVAVVAGDPIGPEELLEVALATFLRDVVRARGWRVAVLGASERVAEIYRRAGLRMLYHGDEAVLDLEDFTLDRPALRAARQGVHRVERGGYQVEVRYAEQLSLGQWQELSELETGWLKDRSKTGFSMQLDVLTRLTGDDALFVIGRDEHGKIAGFLHLVVCHASRTLSLSSMPRREDTPNGFNAFLVNAAASWGREHDFVALSLNFSPFARLLRADAELSRPARWKKKLLLVFKRRLSLQLDNLLMFNRQFAPRFEPRYVVFDQRADLPRALVAMMAAEGYLPFADKVRGADWDDAAELGAEHGALV